jgi:hypothetical protein
MIAVRSHALTSPYPRATSTMSVRDKKGSHPSPPKDATPTTVQLTPTFWDTKLWRLVKGSPAFVGASLALDGLFGLGHATFNNGRLPSEKHRHLYLKDLKPKDVLRIMGDSIWNSNMIGFIAGATVTLFFMMKSADQKVKRNYEQSHHVTLTPTPTKDVYTVNHTGT